MTQAPTLVLDLDGTLVDTAADLVATLNVVLGEQGLPPFALAEAVPMVGHGARVLLGRAYSANGLSPEEPLLDRLTARFIEIYSGHIADHSRPFPGVEAALDRFDAAGWRLAVCTNKLEHLSRRLLGALGFADRFAVIAGQDTYGIRKPDPRHLTETIRAAGGDASRAVMVGDSDVDVRTARAAGIPVVAVTFGYSAVPAAELGADRLIGHFDDLFAAASELLAAPGRREALPER